MSSAAHIRPFEAADWPQLWPVLQATIARGDSFAYAPEAGEDEMRRAWIDAPLTCHVAVNPADELLGSYYLKANQPGLGSHVANCGYVVALAARGQGVASLMGEHSQAEARARGFRAMQFNLVVSTNLVAVRLWQKLGFAIVGTLPGAYAHRTLGWVDAHVMFKSL